MKPKKISLYDAIDSESTQLFAEIFEEQSSTLSTTQLHTLLFRTASSKQFEMTSCIFKKSPKLAQNTSMMGIILREILSECAMSALRELHEHAGPFTESVCYAGLSAAASLKKLEAFDFFVNEVGVNNISQECVSDLIDISIRAQDLPMLQHVVTRTCTSSTPLREHIYDALRQQDTEMAAYLLSKLSSKERDSDAFQNEMYLAARHSIHRPQILHFLFRESPVVISIPISSAQELIDREAETSRTESEQHLAPFKEYILLMDAVQKLIKSMKKTAKVSPTFMLAVREACFSSEALQQFAKLEMADTLTLDVLEKLAGCSISGEPRQTQQSSSRRL